MKQKLRAIIGMLVAIFVFGMGVNLLGTPASNSDGPVGQVIISGIVLLLHVLTAIGIVVVASQLLRLAKGQEGQQRLRLIWGFSAVCFAFVAGVTTMAISSPWSDLASFLMALGFMAALVLYGVVLFRASTSVKQ